jgi:hypothetical protein
MAVWLIVYGKNGLGQFANEAVAQYRDILRNIAMDEKKYWTASSIFPELNSQPKNIMRIINSH